MRHNFTKEQKENVINDYLSKKISKLAIRKKYKIGFKYFKKILREFNIKEETRLVDYSNHRIYSCDFDFFKIVDNEEKAYTLGLLASDGHIKHTKTRHDIMLCLTDLELIEKIKTCLKSNHPIKSFKRSEKHQIQNKIHIQSVEMVHDLEKFNLTGNKTFRTHIPKEIPENLVKHFIRGYFDGDGSIWLDKRRRGLGAVTITSSSLLVLQQIENHLKENNILRKHKSYIEPGHGNCYAIRTSKREEMVLFLSYLYDNANIFMERKKQSYLTLKNRPIKVKNKNCTSKYFGVIRNKNIHKNKYSVVMKIKGEVYNFGSYPTENEAALIYNNKIKELGFPDYMLNKIEEITPEPIQIT